MRDVSSDDSRRTQKADPNESDLELNAFAKRRGVLLRKSDESYQMMNAEQRTIYDQVLSSRTTGGCFFIDRGKTFLVSALCDRGPL
jgi:hypothetical protein